MPLSLTHKERKMLAGLLGLLLLGLIGLLVLRAPARKPRETGFSRPNSEPPAHSAP